MAYGAFGDIRALLQEPPSRGVWERLCAEVRLWREPELSQVALPYVLAQLERWPDDLRVIRPDWATDLLRGRARGAHFTAMARCLRVEDLSPTSEQWDNLSRLDWRSLRHLSLERVVVRSSRLDNPLVLLAAHPWFERLDTLTLDIFDARALRAGVNSGALSHLKSLGLHRIHLQLDDLLDFALAPWPELTHLSFARSFLQRTSNSRTDGSIEPLDEDVFAPKLEAFELAHAHHGRAALHDLRKAAWLPSLKKLSVNTTPQRAGNNHLFDTATVRLLEHADFSALEHLHLNGDLDYRHDEALARNPTIGSLRRLEVTGTSAFDTLSDLAARLIASDAFSEELKSHWRGYVGFD